MDGWMDFHLCIFVSMDLCIYLCIYVSMYLCIYASKECMYVGNVCM